MDGKTAKATIATANGTITLEGSREFVETMVERYASSKIQDKLKESEYSSRSQITTIGGGERNLVAAKRPHGHHEIVAVLAFALTEAGTREFTEEDIRRAYIRAGVRPPKVVAQALRDAKNKYDFLELAGKRGQYRLTNHGDRVVRFDLPRAGGRHEQQSR